MRLMDGFRLAELAAGDETGIARRGLVDSLRQAIEHGDATSDERTIWLGRVTASLRARPQPPSDPRVAALLSYPSTFAPRRRYRPPSGLASHMARWMTEPPSAVRAQRECLELSGSWEE